MSDKIYHVLFLSRRNSARSLMAEALLNKIGQGRFRAYSAGVAPAEGVEPEVVELLAGNGFPVEGLHAKHYREFAGEGAQVLDFVFTLSDTAAGEPQPEWPGLPITAHWSSTDPVLFHGPEWERKRGFAQVLSELERRLKIFVSLPFASLDRISLKAHVDEIGRVPEGAA